MPSKSWKAFELRLAKLLGGERRGADYRNRKGKGGKSDVILKGWSIEAKLLKQPTFGLMHDACIQAEANKDEPDDVPIAVIKKNGKGLQDKDALVVMRLEVFNEKILKPTKQKLFMAVPTRKYEKFLNGVEE